MSDSLVNRLRGRYEVGPDGVYGTRSFSDFIPPISIEAAERIEELEAFYNHGLACGKTMRDSALKKRKRIEELEAQLAAVSESEVRANHILTEIKERVSALVGERNFWRKKAEQYEQESLDKDKRIAELEAKNEILMVANAELTTLIITPTRFFADADVPEPEVTEATAKKWWDLGISARETTPGYGSTDWEFNNEWSKAIQEARDE